MLAAGTGRFAILKTARRRPLGLFDSNSGDVMPFYEYQCKRCGHHLEAMQKVNDAPLKKCPACGKSALERQMSAPVFRLKGGGWYETDFKSDGESKRNLADRPETDAAKADAPKSAKAEVAKDKPAEKAADKGAEKSAVKADGAGASKRAADAKPSRRRTVAAPKRPAPKSAAKKAARKGSSRR